MEMSPSGGSEGTLGRRRGVTRRELDAFFKLDEWSRERVSQGREPRSYPANSLEERLGPMRQAQRKANMRFWSLIEYHPQTFELINVPEGLLEASGYFRRVCRAEFEMNLGKVPADPELALRELDALSPVGRLMLQELLDETSVEEFVAAWKERITEVQQEALDEKLVVLLNHL